jgi:peptidoglycan hydrolase-like protein with peptidoglycan-binding domain
MNTFVMRMMLASLAVVGLVVPVVATSTAAEAAGRPCVQKVIGPGTTGSCVKNIQRILNAQILAGLSVDGVYGTGTRNAVVQFQRNEALSADGIVGASTWSRLCRPNDGGRSNAQIAAGCTIG